MYKLLVADDEQIVLDSIRFIVERNFGNVVVAATARSGREAVEKAEEVKPDIIFMDIKMPGINGIDAIKEISQRHHNTLFVIITAFEQFDFAKEAVNLGVVEYLLKPVNREKIIQVIKKSVEIMETERQKRKRELELMEKVESVLPILEHGFIHTILLFSEQDNELDNYREIFEITEPGGYILTIELSEMESRGNISNRIGLSVRSQNFYPFVRDMLKCRTKCIIGPVMLNRIVVFVPSYLEGDEYSQRLEAIGVAEYVFKKASEKGDADFYIGIGRAYQGMENMIRSYEESLKAIRYADTPGVIHITDVAADAQVGNEYPVLKEKVLLERVSIGDTISALQAFNEIYDWLTCGYAGSVRDIKGSLLELMVLLHRTACDYGVDEGGLLKRQDYFNEILQIEEISNLKGWFRNRIEYISSSICSIRDKKVSKLITGAKEYINNFFGKEITLEDVSRTVNVSPNYFSKLFKEETGENFIDYLTSVRMKKAKELLEEGNYSIKETCYLVGYGDPNYFSRIFKKVVGVSPSEFRGSVEV